MGIQSHNNKLYKTTTLLISLLIIQLARANNLTSTASSTDLINTACSHTHYQALCISSLTSDPRSKLCTDLKCIASISLDIAVNQAKKTQVYIDKFVGSDDKGGLADCKEEYDEAVDDLYEAVRGFERGDFDGVNELVSGAMTACQTCLDGSNEETINGGGNKNDKKMGTFVGKNECFYKMCSNVLAIVKLLGY